MAMKRQVGHSKVRWLIVEMIYMCAHIITRTIYINFVGLSKPRGGIWMKNTGITTLQSLCPRKARNLKI